MTNKRKIRRYCTSAGRMIADGDRRRGLRVDMGHELMYAKEVQGIVEVVVTDGKTRAIHIPRAAAKIYMEGK